MKTKSRVVVRPTVRRDVGELVKFSPLSEKEFVFLLRQRGLVALTALHDEVPVGVVVYELHKKKFELISLAVAAAWRRRGVGSTLVGKLAAKLGGRRDRVGASVRDHLLVAHLFLKANGFACVRVDDDVYRFVLR